MSQRKLTYLDIIEHQTIKNTSAERILELFENQPIALESYECLCIRKYNENENRAFAIFRIICCYDQPLKGYHRIYYRNQIYATPALYTFKKKVLGFDDGVCFFDSTFLIHPSGDIIRLKLIRKQVQLPIYDGAEATAKILIKPIYTYTLKTESKKEINNNEDVLQNIF